MLPDRLRMLVPARYPAIRRYAFDPITGSSTYMEGVVAKQDRSLFDMEFYRTTGKIVRAEFTEGVIIFCVFGGGTGNHGTH